MSLLLLAAFLCFGCLGLSAHGQRARGELHIEVQDPQGALLPASGELVSEGNEFRRTFATGPDGRCIVQDLAFGIYRLTLQAQGFASRTERVGIRSEVPVSLSVTMGLAAVSTDLQVSDAATLVDPYSAGSVYSIGQRAIEERISPPGRGLTDLVDEEPGWLYEANGTLHPRGSQYDVQYVVDGLPLTQNRSPVFAPALETGDVESMRVLTAGYPAEYGRKLGGVIEVNTAKSAPAGLHEQVNLSRGSFSTASGSVAITYAHGKNSFGLSGDGFHTDRYLDPPVLANFTNQANADGFAGWVERDFSDHDRLRLAFRRSAVHFLAPNEFVQQQAGQRQDLSDAEASGQIDYQHTFSPDLLMMVAGSVRDVTATLSSNVLSTPVIVFQDRGYREGYIRADVAAHHHNHDWKAGIDGLFGPVRERLAYTITDPSQFDPGTRLQFQFSDRRWDIEPSAYLQDQIHWANWNIHAGVRFDSYGFVVHEAAWSPRISVSRSFPSAGLLLHASYDRVFQTPAVENLLVASSPQLDAVNAIVVRLPVRPARGDYFEAGLTQAIFGKVRLDANVFRRNFRNYSDDDILLDTGLSFPIAFSRARILGEEIHLEAPLWKRVSGYVSYANQHGIGQGPITGGLFLGSDAVSNLTSTTRFAVTQDQRNTLRARVRVQAARRLWLSGGGQYGSGLPADVAGPDPKELLAEFGPEILSRVNLSRDRVRPNFSLELAVGAQIYHRERRSADFQIQCNNLADRLNVINFASLFSGTAIAPPRSISAGLKLIF